MHVGRIAHLRPALDPGKQPLDPWSKAVNYVSGRRDAVFKAPTRGDLDRHQIFYA